MYDKEELDSLITTNTGSLMQSMRISQICINVILVNIDILYKSVSAQIKLRRFFSYMVQYFELLKESGSLDENGV